MSDAIHTPGTPSTPSPGPVRVKSATRYELKYLINRGQAQALQSALAGYVLPDRHGDAEGAYPISSLYFDTADYKAYWDKIEGHKLRRKVRVRAYGDREIGLQTPVFVEIKQRTNKMMSKRRVRLPYAQAVDPAGFEASAADLSERDRAVLHEVAYLHGMLQLQPAAVVRYDRLAFNGAEEFSDLRVTFDTNLRGRVHDLTLLDDGQSGDASCLPAHLCVLEVKVNHHVPYWLAQLLAQHGCTFRRISKYCRVLEQGGIIRARQRIVTAPGVSSG